MKAHSTMFVRFGFCLLACSVVVGCGPKKPEATVRGAVTLEGKPLHEGGVAFFSTSGTFGNGTLSADGYSLIGPNKIEGIAPGSYTVVVMPSSAQIKSTQIDPQVQVKASAIPTKYSAAATSPLKVDVVSGENVIDLDLDKGTATVVSASRAE